MPATRLKIGTDCSGMETPIMALKQLKVPYEHCFSCDIDKNVKKHLMANFPAKVWYDDLMIRDNEARETPSVDLYVAGFPCQSFSAAGRQEGFRDKRGMIFFGCCDYIDCKRPRAFILENVKGLLRHEKGETFEKVMTTLKSIGDGAYTLQWEVLNTMDHGVPQSRQRVYIVGIRKDSESKKGFTWPEKLQEVSIEKFLDRKTERPNIQILPRATNKVAHRNVKTTLKHLLKTNQKPFSRTFVIDHQASPKFLTIARDKTICITKSRGHGYWLTSRGREMSAGEMLRLQGMSPSSFTNVVSRLQLGAMIGNAMSQNVIERILVRLLPAAKLSGKKLVDRWEKMTPKRKA